MADELARATAAQLARAAAARREPHAGAVQGGRSRRAIARQAPAAASTASADPSPHAGVPMEKWWAPLEEQYRMQGFDREADAIRACRLEGGWACERILTIDEVHALWDVANGAAGDPAKVEEGMKQNPLLAGLTAVAGTGARAAPAAAPPPGPGPGPVLSPQQLGALLLLQMLSMTMQLNDLAAFEDTLTRYDYVILESPKSVYCETCHPDAANRYVGETRYPRWATEEHRRLIDSGRATWSEANGWNGPMSESTPGGTGFRVRGFFEFPPAAPVQDPGSDLDRPGALYLLTQNVHDPTGTSQPMRIGASGGVRITPGPGITQKAVAVAEVELPDGARAYFAAGNDARLSPAQVDMLVAAGIPRAHIFNGAAFTLPNPKDNHAEQLILRHMPAGSRIVRWGISWAGPLRGEPCGYCAQHGVDMNLVETREMSEALLGLP